MTRSQQPKNKRKVLDTSLDPISDEIRLPENQTPDADSDEHLFSAWRAAPSPSTLTPLLQSLHPTIQRALNTYGFGNDPNMETSAQLHVIDVLPRFDPKKAKLSTFIHTELRRMQRLGPQQNSTIQAPERARLDSRALYSAEQELSDELGRPPTVEELADHTGFSLKRIERVRMATRPTMSEEAVAAGSGEDSAPRVIGTEQGRPEQVWLEAFYSNLTDPTDKLIFEWSTGWKGAPVLGKSRIADKLGLSPGAISQRSDKLAKELQALVTSGNRLL